MATTANATELRDHLREWMRKPTEDLKAHLEEMGVDTGIIRQKQALVKLHADHHGTAPLTGSASVGDKAPEPAPAKRPAPKPAPARKAPAAKAPAKAAPKAPARKPATKAATETAPKPPARRTRTAAKPAPAKATPARRAPAKAAPAKPAPAKAKANGKAPAPATAPAASANANKHDLAKRLIDMVAREFAGESDENKAKLAYWLHGLPTGYPNGGGGGYMRYWPSGLPRPTTAGWRKPE
jgi:hypothetical protein